MLKKCIDFWFPVCYDYRHHGCDPRILLERNNTTVDADPQIPDGSTHY